MLSVEDAKVKIIDYLKSKNVGVSKIKYKLRDWGISRQRYWGCPIPILYREDGEVITVTKKDLPVILPNYIRKNKTIMSCSDLDEWKKTTCPITGMSAVRKTDTFDTFL